MQLLYIYIKKHALYPVEQLLLTSNKLLKESHCPFMLQLLALKRALQLSKEFLSSEEKSRLYFQSSVRFVIAGQAVKYLIACEDFLLYVQTKASFRKLAPASGTDFFSSFNVPAQHSNFVFNYLKKLSS